MEMNVDIVVPSTADGSLEVTIVAWLKNAGDSVAKGHDVAEASTEKITLYITAPADGVLESVRVSAGQKARVGEVVGVIASGGEK